MEGRGPNGSRRRGARVRRAVALAALSLTIAGGMGACGGDDGGGGGGGGAGAGEGNGESFKIGVAMKTQLQRRWQFDLRAMQEQAKKYGDELVVQWANDDPNTQASQVENLLSQGVDALIIVPVDGEAAAPLANQARRENVPVVTYDIAISGAPVDYYVERNNAQAGELQVEAAMRETPKGQYALLKGDAAISVAQIMTDQWLQKLKGADGVELVYNQWVKNFDPATAQSNAEDVLSRTNDQVDAFLSLNDGMATGIVQALKGRGLAGKVFVSGLDADPANMSLIAQGHQTMTVWTPIDDQGRAAAEAAHQLAAGQKPASDTMSDFGGGKVPTKQVAVEEVNRENLCDFVKTRMPKGWADPAKVFARTPGACEL
jgi:D-xylose transport system substrate-binding protein